MKTRTSPAKTKKNLVPTKVRDFASSISRKHDRECIVIGVIADTHIPTRAKELPKKLIKQLEKVDLILHAGDLVTTEILNMLERLNKTEAVFGNMDEEEIKIKLLGKKILEVGGMKIGLIHGCDIRWNLTHRVPDTFEDQKIDCLVYGHTHIARNERIGNRLYFNPGSPTDRIFTTASTYGILEIKNGKIEGRIIEL